jgi:hypothetical protein
MTEEEKKDIEGLEYLRWSQFDCPYEEGSGYKFMEREPVLILDRVVKSTRMVLTIELGYVSPRYAEVHSIISTSPHRIGKAIKIKCLCPKKRMKLVKHLVLKGAKSIAVDRESLTFDTDDLVTPQFRITC